MHHGVKGQKWGVRKKSKSRVTLSEVPDNAIIKAHKKLSKKYREEAHKNHSYDLRNSEGKKIGTLDVYDESKDSMNVVWLGVNKKYRGQGYATDAMKQVIDLANKKKVSQVTLEVPGDSPDAHHIYKKLGFKDDKKISSDDDIWGGLTSMKKELKHSELMDDMIMHYGVKGMKWGVTRARNKVGMTMAKGSRNQVAYATETYKNARDIEKNAGRIVGRGNSTARMAAGKWASERANRERNNADRDSSAGAFNGNRRLSNINARNQNKLSKLESKAKKTGNPKDKQNAEVFRAYANEVEKRSKGIRKDINDNYAKSQQARNESFKARDEYLKAVEKYVYGDTNIQRPNINRINDENYQTYRKQVNNVKKEIKKRKSQAKHSEIMDDVIMHHGVKGMKWGRRQSTIQKASKKLSNVKKVKTKTDEAGEPKTPKKKKKLLTKKEILESIHKVNKDLAREYDDYGDPYDD